jgi:hypothetical protein
MRAKLFAVAIIGLIGPANAQSPDQTSANAVMPGCVQTLGSGLASFEGGYCLGLVRAIAALGPLLNHELRFCPPHGVTAGQDLRVVVDFINRNPGRMHEIFDVLALEAFRNSWRCRN